MLLGSTCSGVSKPEPTELDVSSQIRTHQHKKSQTHERRKDDFSTTGEKGALGPGRYHDPTYPAESNHLPAHRPGPFSHLDEPSKQPASCRYKPSMKSIDQFPSVVRPQCLRSRNIISCAAQSHVRGSNGVDVVGGDGARAHLRLHETNHAGAAGPQFLTPDKPMGCETEVGFTTNNPGWQGLWRRILAFCPRTSTLQISPAGRRVHY
ncbi:hypothetical protein B0T20DRAFT_274796 [Sordaria brevicollis]|uniref:Uncharacterized protein n=1 Tax=Sordaria brevicollis TaxID=83679 RepID=A0AAE0PAX3_SORBR|nr:hypothetical protein B0T20DRAFT_274796 [Sordaria brevicollis]